MPRFVPPAPGRHAAYSLAEYPGELVRFACTRCDRAGQYAKATLIARHGAETRLPDLLRLVASCPRQVSYSDPCGVYYPDLASP